MKTTIEIYALTDVGQSRAHNEDYSAVCFNTADTEPASWRFDPIKGVGQKVALTGDAASVLLVADGMGGANAGEVASREAVRVIRGYLDQKGVRNDRGYMERLLKNSMVGAHKHIVSEAKKDPEKQGMGTTAIVACIFDTCLYVAWCGDSRCYVWRNGRLYADQVRGNETHYPFTDDHSMVWEWHMKKPEMMKSDLSRTHPDSNIITQSLGDEQHMPKPDFRSLDIQKGDKILLCSDGLNGMMADAGIAGIMSEPTGTQAIVRRLVSEANRNGGHDNITALMATVTQGPKPKKHLPNIPPNEKQNKSTTNKLLYAIIAVLFLVIIALSTRPMWQSIFQAESKQSAEEAYQEALEANDSTAYANFINEWAGKKGDGDSISYWVEKAQAKLDSLDSHINLGRENTPINTPVDKHTSSVDQGKGEKPETPSGEETNAEDTPSDVPTKKKDEEITLIETAEDAYQKALEKNDSTAYADFIKKWEDKALTSEDSVWVQKARVKLDSIANPDPLTSLPERDSNNP